MANAIQTVIADLAREKRAGDTFAEPIICQNADMQAAFEEIDTALSGLPPPLPSVLPGDLLVGIGVNRLGRLPAETAGQVLTSNGILSNPSYTNIPSLLAIAFQGGSILSAYVDGTWTPIDATGQVGPLGISDARFAQIGGWFLATCEVFYPSTTSQVSALMSLPAPPSPQFGAGYGLAAGSNAAQVLQSLVTQVSNPSVAFVLQPLGILASNAQLANVSVSTAIWFHA